MCQETGCEETHFHKRSVSLSMEPCVYRRLMRVQESLRGSGPQTVTEMVRDWMKERLEEEERQPARQGVN